MRVLLLLCLLTGLARAESTRVAKGYRNGRPMNVRVVSVDWTEVEVATARAFRAMRAAAARNGINLKLVSGFRTHEKQQQLYREWRRGTGNPAARPGFSNHQSGRALDISVDSDPIREWLKANAKRFGFHRTVRNEPWHWEFFGERRRLARRPRHR